MTNEKLSVGVTANDGTGDTLRQAGQKINSNFAEIYELLGGDSAGPVAPRISLDSNGVVFKGFVDNGIDLTLRADTISADRLVVFPDAGGNVVIDTATQTLTNKTLTSPKIGTAINDTNGNELVKLTATGSAVNEFTIANGASTTGPTLSATGSATNLNMFLTSKGTGSVEINKVAFSSQTLTNATETASTSATLIIGNRAASAAIAVTLGQGTTVGEYKIFVNKGGGTMTVTPTHSGSSIFSQGSTFALASKDGCTCVWDGSEWYLVGNQGEVTVG